MNQEIEKGDIVDYKQGNPDRKRYKVMEIKKDRALCCAEDSRIRIWLPIISLAKVNQ